MKNVYELPKWEWSMSSDFWIRFAEWQAPCAFHRLMLRLLLGIHWRKAS